MINQLKDIKEICRLLESQQEDYNQRNYGDANNWDRHIRHHCKKFTDTYDKSPWEFMSSYIKTVENIQTQSTEDSFFADIKEGKHFSDLPGVWEESTKSSKMFPIIPQ